MRPEPVDRDVAQDRELEGAEPTGQYPMTKTNPRPDVLCLVVLVPAIVCTVRPVHQED